MSESIAVAPAEPEPVPPPAVEADVTCKLKKKCQDKEASPKKCWNVQCTGWIHTKCCTLLLDKFEIKKEHRPAVEGLFVFCTKTCYGKWHSAKKKELRTAAKEAKEAGKKKHKVPWEEDGSIDPLMDWLTTHGDYNNYCGANGNKGKSKAQCHKEIAEYIKQKKPDANRTNRDVENKIVKLERQFREATDWANNTGQGVEDGTEFEKAVLARCRYYRELEDIMLDRPNAKPLASNESEGYSSSSSDEDVLAPAGGNDDDDKEEEEGPTENTTTPSTITVADSEKSSTKKSDEKKKKKRRLTAKTEDSKASKRSKSKNDELIKSLLVDSNLETCRGREVEAMERQADARMLEAVANAEKARKETSLLSIEEKVKTLEARKRLLDNQICTEEQVDRLFPLPQNPENNYTTPVNNSSK